MPLKFVSHRCLENTPVCERTLHIWDQVMTYVEKVESKKFPKPSSKSYEVISSWMKDKLIRVKLEIFKLIACHLQKFLKQYQTDRPMVPFLLHVLGSVIRTLMQKIGASEDMHIFT